MSRLIRLLSGAAAGAVLAGATVTPAFASGTGQTPRPTLVPRPAVTAGTASAPACRPFTAQRQRAHTDVAMRLTTLDQLTTTIIAAGDPYGVNGGQRAALGDARTGLVALDEKIQTGCYTDRTALDADTRTIFTGYRVYWLRVPQTHILEAADRLGAARQTLGASAAKLAGLVGDNAKAKADLAAMNDALANADAHVGNPPALGGSVGAVPALAPAVDMTADVAALKAARRDLEAARKALDTARRDALRVVADLGANPSA
ncbi:MAG TPA: hypothetical protein VFC99_08320 [Acidimicrobiia bacterium]|nr:hypothetical protein [Acidimicrobiia bacterium]